MLSGNRRAQNNTHRKAQSYEEVHDESTTTSTTIDDKETLSIPN